MLVYTGATLCLGAAELAWQRISGGIFGHQPAPRDRLINDVPCESISSTSQPSQAPYAPNYELQFGTLTSPADSVGESVVTTR